MFPLLPFESLVITSKLPPEAVSLRLQWRVEPTQLFRLSEQHKAFQGWVQGNRFAFRRIIHYGNPLLPRIRGRLEPDGKGTRAVIRLRPSWFAGLFMTIWYGLAGMTMYWTLTDATQTDKSPLALLGFLALILMVHGFQMAGFAWEANKAKKLLAEAITGGP